MPEHRPPPLDDLEWEFVKPRFYWLKHMVRDVVQGLDRAQEAAEAIHDWRLPAEIDAFEYDDEYDDRKQVSNLFDDLDEVRASLDQVSQLTNYWESQMEQAGIHLNRIYNTPEAKQ